MSTPALSLLTSQAALASTSLLAQMRLATRFTGPQGYLDQENYTPQAAFAFMGKIDPTNAEVLRRSFQAASSKEDFHPMACTRFRAVMCPYFDGKLRQLGSAEDPLQALREAGFEASANYSVLEELAHAQLISDAGIAVFVEKFSPLVNAEVERLNPKTEQKYFLHGYANLERLSLALRVFFYTAGALCMIDLASSLFSSAERINIPLHLLGGLAFYALAQGVDPVIARLFGYTETMHRGGTGSETDAIRFNQYTALRDVLTIMSGAPDIRKLFED